MTQEKKTERLIFACTKGERDEAVSISERHDRTTSYITHKLYLRGLAAYHRDGLLEEPERRFLETTKRDSRRTAGVKRQKRRTE